ncbi:TIGR02302 family protein [Phaeovulum sp. NW3]|uniref:TIGR02302 family protein n=1 Tax=Phaeovulum sp. NW3 TaxID=2934933 RepID=UPI0020225DCF|nr:TIGR02302 family protein [Phaeovulum sp. NW3]MCL7463797.1 TIGR02302 family protein [Phaeovulum sp. NW3]
MAAHSPRHPEPTAAALKPLARPIALTRVGMVVERALRAFWPALSLLALTLAALAFGAQDLAGARTVQAAAAVLALGGLASLGWGLWRFRWPSRAEAVARLDATLPGRPIAALTDRMALGGADPAARALWAAHQARMAARAAAARPVPPAPDLARRDPFALRLSALTALVVALIFGAPARVGDLMSVATGAPGPAEAAMGAAWEGWAEPPRYTGKPGLYLNAITADTLALPEGTRLSFRFYGPLDTIGFSETVSNPAALPQQGQADPGRRDLEAVRSGLIAITGPGGREFQITIQPDAAPAVEVTALATRRADGRLQQPFRALDDYGVTGGQARITLDLAVVPRRYGLALPPEPREDLVFDLPLPITGSRADFTESLVEDAARHPWANLPVKLTLEVEDGRAQTGQSTEQVMELPGRRFFDPLAAALIEARRDLLWSRDNGPRVEQWLRAVAHRPDGFIRRDDARLMLQVAIRRLDAALDQGTLDDPTRDELAEALWQLAELLEDGGLADALEAMRQAQERLSEAIRNGASPDEIAKLMQELKEATDNYLRMLAEQAPQEDGPQFGRQPESQQITGDQIQQMMDEIQRLMEEGRMAEAQELLDQLSRMLENLQVRQGQGGEGDMPGGQAMRDLGETLREQQQLSDEAFREMQQGPGQQDGQQGQPQPGQGQDSGGPPQEGQSQDRQPGGGQTGEQGQPGQQGGEGTDEGAGDQGRSLAERQRALRQELGRQEGLLPRLGNEAGDAARQRLNDAGRAMEQAEEALRRGDNGTAIDRQADAIEALREGMRSLGEALAQEEGRQQGQQGEQRLGQAGSGQGRDLPRDPLGRTLGEGGRIGTDDPMLGGEDVYRRARDLLDEIRRRSGERLRSDEELDYLRRLLDRF